MREESLIEALQDINDIKCAIEGIAYAENKINWEQRRYEIAKTVLPKMLDWITARGTIIQESIEDNRVARNAVFFADALIAELKKTNEKE